MKIAAGICEYGDVDGLYRCLNSLGLGNGGIDKAIIIHGRFRDFKLDKPDAYEQTKKIVSRFPQDTIELMFAKGLTEIESRNVYLENKITDFKEFRRQLQFVMDVQSDFPIERQHQIFDIQLDGSIPAYHGPQPRLFLRPGTIKYWGKHYWWMREETKQLFKGQSDAARIIGGIHLLHDHTIRDSSYYNASVGYKEWQQEHEGEEVQIEEKKINKEREIKKKTF